MRPPSILYTALSIQTQINAVYVHSILSNTGMMLCFTLLVFFQPLDTLTGAPTTPRPAQQPVPQASVPAQPHGSVPAIAKQGVPCYYFQKGMCTKGDRCTFLHAPQSAGNPAPQPPAKVFTPALQPNHPLKNSWTKPNSSSQQSVPAVGIVDKPKANSAHDGKPLHHKQNLTSRADQSPRVFSNSYAQPGATKRYQPQPPVQDGLTDNGMEAGEFVREPSAGSGMIVGGADDDAQQSFKGNHTTYNHRANGIGGMTRQTHGGYESERPYRNSAERSSSEKRISQRELIPAVAAASSDLRHRLLKQRKLSNNSRTIEAPGRHDTRLEDESNDQHCSRGEQQDGRSRSRLRDRIRLPGETSFDRLGSRSEEWDRGSRARLSPPKPSDLRGRLHERLKARSAEEIPGNSAKDLGVKENSSEDTESLNFAGPKSLAELKAKKGVGRSGEDAIVKGLGSSRVTSEIVSSREAAPFEGPKPLSAILKRKREASSGVPAAQPGIIQESDNYAAGAEEFQTVANDTVGENMEGIGEEEEEEAFHPEDDVVYDDNTDEAAAAQELDEYQDAEAAAEDYDDETAAAQELEEHQDGEAAAEDYDYEAADVNAEEENDYQEYQDDDDDLEDEDDDFAQKVSVMIS